MNGCHNRPAPGSRAAAPIQDGWYVDGYTRTPKLVPATFRMTVACQYTKTELGQRDAGCVGCKWRAP